MPATAGNRGKEGKGKELDIVNCGNGSLLKIQFKEGGKVPSELEGLFTSHAEATRVINAYLGK